VTDFTAASSDALLLARGISKTFPGVRALQNVSLRLVAGRLLALLGENGAGKSTLMNVLSGIVIPDEGQILLDGAPIQLSDPRSAKAHGIATIHQELSLCPNLTVAENVFLGCEPRTNAGLIDLDRMRRETAALLKRMNLAVDPHQLLGALRIGQQQVVEIARALSANARIVIMDEPTSALSQSEVDALLERIADLKRSGVAVVYITHKFEELARIVDDIAIMRDGKLVAQGEATSFTTDQILQHMVGRPPSVHQSQRTQDAEKQFVLEARDVRLPHPERKGDWLVDQVSVSVARGEVLGIFGLIGAGRTELLETIFGVHAAAASLNLSIDGKTASFDTPAAAIEAGVALAPEDRKRDGLLLDMDSSDNASLACLRAAKRWGLLSPGREKSLLTGVLERLNVRGSLQAPIRNLSGGNQQKVILGKWLAAKPRVLLLDEPTRGIDINARHEIYQLIEEFLAEGLGIILASSDLNEVLALSDRILVMCEGRAVAEFPRESATARTVLAAALPKVRTKEAL